MARNTCLVYWTEVYSKYLAELWTVYASWLETLEEQRQAHTSRLHKYQTIIYLTASQGHDFH